MATTQTARRGLGWADWDPFRAAWRLLTNVKFALVTVTMAAGVGLIGVVIPQLPAEMRGNPAAQAAWYELQRDDFGRWTDPMRRLELFEVYQAWWFYALWAVIIASVVVCTVSRIRPTMRSIHRPPLEVPDSYYETASHRASFTVADARPGLEQALRRRRYRVRPVREADGATHLFAERFGWSQYGTFVSHLALIMVLVGGLLTTFAGFDRTLAMAEQTGAAPVLGEPGPGQIFLDMRDAVRGIDDDGNIVDYRSFLDVRRGDEVVSCVSTVNDPCEAFGYRFHQAAFFNDLARIEITDPDGRLVYADVLDFNAEVAPAPYLRVTDTDGRVLLEQAVPQLGSEGSLAVSELAVPAVGGGDVRDLVQVPIGWRLEDGAMTLFVSDGFGDVQQLAPGDSATLFPGAAFSFDVSFEGIQAVPAVVIADMPGAPGGSAVVQMPEEGDETPFLVIDGVDEGPLLLAPGETKSTASGYSYRFIERVDGAAINVKRDPGDTFIFLAVAMALVGLATTFYVPRRRLWAKVTGSRVQLAGVAERTTRFDRELRQIGAELGAEDAVRDDDAEERW